MRHGSPNRFRAGIRERKQRSRNRDSAEIPARARSAPGVRSLQIYLQTGEPSVAPATVGFVVFMAMPHWLPEGSWVCVFVAYQ
jgi:hypothetical protein